MSRQIIVANSLHWLATQSDQSIPNTITGICDMDEVTEMKQDINKYVEFFCKIADLIFKKQNPNGYAIFIQTDRKYNREWIDKSNLLTTIAYQNGFKLVWHKIVLRREADRVDLHRPGYSHMLCYTVNGTSGAATPDVLPVSKKLYENATPLDAAVSAVEFVKRYNTKNPTIVDPFVGQGTIVAVANYYGIDAIGIDIDSKQAERAKSLNL